MDLSREQLLQFLAPSLADAVLADGRDLLAGRRAEVSVLSCDVAAFRPRAEANPEAAIDALNMALDGLAAIVWENGGTLMSFPGDGVLAVFGAPLPDASHRDAAERARDQMADAGLEAVNARLATAGAAPVELDLAVESGPATVGVIGTAPRWEYAAIGEVTAAAIRATSD